MVWLQVALLSSNAASVGQFVVLVGYILPANSLVDFVHPEPLRGQELPLAWSMRLARYPGLVPHAAVPCALAHHAKGVVLQGKAFTEPDVSMRVSV